MPVTTTTNTYNINVPSVFTVDETVHIVTLPGVPSDCSGLALVDPYLPASNFAGQTNSAVLGFTGVAVNAANKNIYLKNVTGDFVKLIGRPADYTYSAGNTKARAGVTKHVGYGAKPSSYKSIQSSTDAPLLANLLGLQDVINRTGNFLSIDSFLITGKVSAELWLYGMIVYKRIASGVITYSNTGTFTGFDSVEVFAVTLGAASGSTVSYVFTYAQKETVATWHSVGSNRGIVQENLLKKVTGTFQSGGPVTSIQSLFIWTDSTASQFGTNTSARPVSLGPCVKFISPNTYIYQTDGDYSNGTAEDLLRATCGISEFSLMHFPGIATNQARFRGTPYCSGWHLRTIASDLSNMLTLAEGLHSQTNLLDDIFKTRNYVRAPVIIGSCDGGDFAIDAQVPAPFGNMRIIYSPRIVSYNNTVDYLTADTVVSSSASLNASKLVADNQSLQGEFGSCIYEPVVVEKIATLVSVPSTYLANVKLREKRIRTGSNAATLLNGKQTIRYGGGAYNDGPFGTISTNSSGVSTTNDINTAYDLSTIPTTFTITVVLLTGAPPANITIQWCLWDSVAQAWAATGSSALVALSETFGGAYARYTGATPSAPTANRQTMARMSVAGGYTFAAYWSPAPIRRRIWPWLVTKNKLLGSDATIATAENLGAIWNDPNPQPTVLVLGDWILGWSSGTITWSNAGLSASCTNRAASPEAGILPVIPGSPTAVSVRDKATGLYQQFANNAQYSVGRIFSSAAARPQLASGTVYVVTAVTVINWANKQGTGTLGSSTWPIPDNVIDRDIATTFVREYEVTQP